MFKTVRWMLALALMLGLLGCSGGQMPSATLTVEPMDPFSGEASRFKSLVSMHTGGVKIDYEGEYDTITLSAEVWEDGKVRETHSMMGGTLARETTEGRYAWEGEAVFEVDYSDNEEGQTVYTVKSAFISDEDGQTTTYPIVANRAHGGRSNIVLHDAIHGEGQESVILWGFQATDENLLHTMDFTPERLALTRWAVVLKLTPGTDERSQLTITPIEESDWLQEGTHYHRGSVQAKYDGEPGWLQLEAEVWKAGELRETIKVHELALGGEDGEVSWSGTVRFNVDDPVTLAGRTSFKARTTISDDMLQVNGETMIEDVGFHPLRSNRTLRETIVGGRAERMAVWGIQGSLTDHMRSVTDFSPEQLKRADLAIVFTLNVAPIE